MSLIVFQLIKHIDFITYFFPDKLLTNILDVGGRVEGEKQRGKKNINNNDNRRRRVTSMIRHYNVKDDEDDDDDGGNNKVKWHRRKKRKEPKNKFWHKARLKLMLSIRIEHKRV